MGFEQYPRISAYIQSRAARERRSAGTIAEIERQMREAAARKKVRIQRHETKPKYTIDFSVLDDLEDDE